MEGDEMNPADLQRWNDRVTAILRDYDLSSVQEDDAGPTLVTALIAMLCDECEHVRNERPHLTADEFDPDKIAAPEVLERRRKNASKRVDEALERGRALLSKAK